ncbi:MAG: agmatine deiminase family protein [Planctomycetota bacterium]|nr:agmatine deiminase family protein [Planctomycetota bacterium]
MTEDRPPRRFPAEWEPHRATWIAWPHNRETWPGVYEQIPAAFTALIRALRLFEEVRLLVPDALTRAAVTRRDDLGEGHPLRIIEAETDDAWIRDYGPIFTRTASGELLATLWRFNAWGGKYSPWERDARAGREVASWSGVPAESIDRVLEGGSVDSNGGGALLTSESCLLNPNRNPGMSRQEIEAMLRRHLGVRRVFWLGGGIAGDDTDGHVDDVARFVDERTVAAAVEHDPHDPNHAPLKDNLERLQRMKDRKGRALRVVELPMPEPVSHAGERMPASYVNFLIVNGGVLVPTYRNGRDERALDVLRGLFPGRQVVGIDCSELILGLGGVHCLTLEQPA